jgi:hypothetical protein
MLAALWEKHSTLSLRLLREGQGEFADESLVVFKLIVLHFSQATRL